MAVFLNCCTPIKKNCKSEQYNAELVLLLPGTKNLFFFHPTIRKEPHLETYTQSWIHKSYPSLTNINFIL